jgi:hypothetical protein
MCDLHTGKAAFADNLLHQAFDLRLGVIIQRGPRLIEQQHLGRVSQPARKRDSLRFASGKVGDVPRGVSDEADPGEQFADLIVRQFFSTLPWPEAQVLRHRSRKKIWPLRDHAHPAAQIAGRELPVVSAVEEYGPAGRLTQPVQQPEEGGLSRSAPVVALLTNGVEMDVLEIAYSEFSDADREAIVAAYPRTEHFKEDIIQTFYDGIKHKPETTFGNVKADVLADKDPKFQRMNFCSVIRGSQWKALRTI